MAKDIPLSVNSRIQKIKNFLVNFSEDESGQATIEYILILVVAVIGAAGLGSALLAVIDDSVLYLGGQLEKDLKTGRADLSVWSN